MNSSSKPELVRQRTGRLPDDYGQAAAARNRIQPAAAHSKGSQILALVFAWTAVSLPLAWGVSETLRKTMALFQ
jgi:hypothetical protein